MVQVCSKNYGPVTLNLPDDTVVKADFKETRDPKVFMADVEYEVAAVLLNVPGYWKPGCEDVDLDEEGENDEKPPLTLSVETYGDIKNAKELAELAKACEDREVIMQVIAIELQGQNRDSWNKILNARFEALKPAE